MESIFSWLADNGMLRFTICSWCHEGNRVLYCWNSEDVCEDCLRSNTFDEDDRD